MDLLAKKRSTPGKVGSGWGMFIQGNVKRLLVKSKVRGYENEPVKSRSDDGVDVGCCLRCCDYDGDVGSDSFILFYSHRFITTII